MLPQVYEAGRGLAFHFDKDEHAMATRQQMLQPAASSVLYLSGSVLEPPMGAVWAPSSVPSAGCRRAGVRLLACC